MNKFRSSFPSPGGIRQPAVLAKILPLDAISILPANGLGTTYCTWIASAGPPDT